MISEANEESSDAMDGQRLLNAALAVAGAIEGAAQVASDVIGVACVDVHADVWREVMRGVREAGGRLDWLGAVDHGDDECAADVVALVRDDSEDLLIRTATGSNAALPSIRDIFPGVAWHEREAAQLVGVYFEGGDERPLLLLGRDQEPALRRSFPLVARLQKPWPGAAGSGRRARVPGNNPQWHEAG